MDATALATSGPAIIIHAMSALLALMLGTLVLLLPKGTRIHKAMGRVWIALMLVVAGTSFWISEIRMFGPYSFIHVLSLYTIVGIGFAVRAVRRGEVRTHRVHMTAIYCGALILAGAFTLLPGRRMHAVLFADGGSSALTVALGTVAVIGAIYGTRRYIERRILRST